MDNTDKRYSTKFRDVVYEIPYSMLEGKKSIRVKFKALPNSTAGAVYYIRLIRQQ